MLFEKKSFIIKLNLKKGQVKAMIKLYTLKEIWSEWQNGNSGVCLLDYIEANYIKLYGDYKYYKNERK